MSGQTVTWKQGATVRQAVRYLDPSTNLPVNLSTYTAKAELRRSTSDVAAILSLTTENDGITLDADGWITLIITHAQTLELSGKYVTDIFVKAAGADGDYVHIVELAFYFPASATRWP